MENGKIWTIFALAAGFFIGKYWEKIWKKSKPYVETTTQKVIGGSEEARKFLEKQKEKVISKAKLGRKGRKAKVAAA